MMELMMSNKSKDKKKKKVEVQQVPEGVAPPGFYQYQAGLIVLAGEFNDENIMPIVKSIYEYNMMPEDVKPDGITLIINSPGGTISSCLHLIDAMKTSALPVTTIGQGMVASCGILTLMAGDRRLATHNTSMMSHQFAAGSSGKEHELLARAEHFKTTAEVLLQHYKKCTGKSKRYILKNLLTTTDIWLTAEECVEHGIIDEVVVTY